MTVAHFTAKERLRFRKLLEVANSTTYTGERDAARGAATRLAKSHGMSLREAAGMADHVEEPAPASKPHHRPGPAGFPADFGAASAESLGRWWSHRRSPEAAAAAAQNHVSEMEQYAADKRRHAEAMADAVRRGLDAEERRAEERAKAARQHGRKSTRRSKSAWRPRPDFIRVLLKETTMSAKEIASVAGVTIYDVFREKLLMRRVAG